MADLAASGLIASPLESLRSLLANVAAWQTFTGTNSAATADDKIYLIGPPAPTGDEFTVAELSALRPFAVINHGPNWSASRRATGPAWIDSGTLTLRIEEDVPSQYTSERDAEVWFLNNLGAIVSGMLNYDEGSGYLVPIEISWSDPPQRVRPESEGSEGDYFTVELLISYGHSK